MNVAEPLVLVPGLKSDHRLWSPQVARFGARHVIHVPTEALRAGDVEAMAQAALDSSPARFALAGVSMGGYVALAMQRAQPQRITRLALLATSARPDTPEGTRARAESLADAQRSGLAAMTRARLVREFFAPPPPDGDIATTMVAMAEATGLALLEAQVRACATRPDARPSLAAIDVPVLILCGRDDAVIAPAASHEMAAAVRHARLVELPQCGHNLTLEQPDAVNQALAQWLAANEPGSAR